MCLLYCVIRDFKRYPEKQKVEQNSQKLKNKQKLNNGEGQRDRKKVIERERKKGEKESQKLFIIFLSYQCIGRSNKRERPKQSRIFGRMKYSLT